MPKVIASPHTSLSRTPRKKKTKRQLKLFRQALFAKTAKKWKKKKTRKKRGGWRREWLVDSNDEPYYECPHKEPPREWTYKEGIKISDDSVKPPQEAQELIIEEMEETENSGDPILVMNHTKNPHAQSFTRSADAMCNANFKPLKKNESMEGSGRKKKTRKKRGGVYTQEQIDAMRRKIDNITRQKNMKVNILINGIIKKHYQKMKCII